MLDRLNAVLAKVSERQDLVLAMLIMAVVFMLILPLPTLLVDMLIALNMAIAALLLMVAIYLSSPLDFSSLPAALLISTLFRLALSISTTRLILLHGDAGAIVETFGKFVVGGNLAVGLVVFLILTIVQFVVITKGAERVAEVSARFSLDALPGKQLSIDADVRAGALTLEEARTARARVQQESKMYGSMDGAMKFVKGDAIASLIIVFVNLLGGLAIGVLQRDLSFGEAGHKYSILSIGDGLVAQIPALFISIAAGIVVTRVADDKEDANLGREIGGQIAREPRALLVAAVMLGLMGLVPGFPLFVFLGLGALLAAPGLAGLLTARRPKAHSWEDATASDSETAASDPTPSSGGDFSAARDPVFAPTSPVLVELASSVRALGSIEQAREAINQARVTLYYRLGAPLPVIDIRINPGLEADRYRIFVGEIPATEGFAPPGEAFVFDREDSLRLFNIAYRRGEDFLPGVETLWSPLARASDLDAARVRWKGPLELIAHHCELTLAKFAASFVGIQETRFLLSRMEADFPDLVKEAQHTLPIQGIADLLRRLVQEQVSIRDLRALLSAVVEWGAREKDPILLVEHVRGALARQISYQYSVGRNILPAWLLDTEMEETVRNGIRQTSSASYIALDPDVSRRLVARVSEAIGEAARGDHPPALVTAMDVRRYVRRLIEGEMPQIPVLSYQEVAQEVTLQPMGRISL